MSRYLSPLTQRPYRPIFEPCRYCSATRRLKTPSDTLGVELEDALTLGKANEVWLPSRRPHRTGAGGFWPKADFSAGARLAGQTAPCEALATCPLEAVIAAASSSLRKGFVRRGRSGSSATSSA